MSEPIPVRNDVHDGPPPFLGTWRRVYMAALTYLLVIIVLLFLFSKAATT